MDHEINISDWPSKSPDLNAIENVWSMLKDRLKKRIRKLGITAFKSEKQLIKAAQEEWEALDWNKIDGMILAMPRRMQAVLDSHGEWTKY